MARLNQLSGSPTHGRRTGETRQCYTAPTAEAAAQKAVDAVLHKAAAGKTRFEITIDQLENGQWRAQV